MLPGLIALHVSPVGTKSVRFTVPAKPFNAATVIVELAMVPAFTPVGEVPVILKSVTLKVTVTVWDREPLVPVTVT